MAKRNKKPNEQNNKSHIKKNTHSQTTSNKKSKKLTRAQYEELCKIEYVPFDTYSILNFTITKTV